MSLAILITENVLIGCVSWAPVIALLLFTDAVSAGMLDKIVELAKAHTAAAAFVGLIAVYPLGAMMNTVSYVVSWVFADRLNRSVLKDADANSFNDIYVYVLAHGTEPLIREIQSLHVPTMRLTRGVVLPVLLLAAILIFARPAAWPYALICLLIGVLGTVAYYLTVLDWKREMFAAYRVLKQNEARSAVQQA